MGPDAAREAHPQQDRAEEFRGCLGVDCKKDLQRESGILLRQKIRPSEVFRQGFAAVAFEFLIKCIDEHFGKERIHVLRIFESGH